MKDRHDVVARSMLDEDGLPVVKRVFRGSLQKTKASLQMIMANNPVKTLDEFTSIDLPDPFTMNQFKGYHRTSVQEFVGKFADKLLHFNTLALSCPCGAGKTLAGIMLMAKLKKQTLIISTRCAINDQWRNTLLKAYKENIIVQTNDGKFTYNPSIKKFIKITRAKSDGKKIAVKDIVPDVYIYSPQFLTSGKTENKFPVSCGLIIYDEVHSQLSKEFGKVLLQPFKNVMSGKTKEVPIMVGLSATYPASGEYHDLITRIFGTILTNKSTITDTPVFFYDLRDEYVSTDLGKHDTVDKFYDPVDDYEFVHNILHGQVPFFTKFIEPTIVGKYLRSNEDNEPTTSDSMDTTTEEPCTQSCPQPADTVCMSEANLAHDTPASSCTQPPTDPLAHDSPMCSRTVSLEDVDEESDQHSPPANRGDKNAAMHSCDTVTQNEEAKTMQALLEAQARTTLCGFVITSTIKSSVYTWIRFYMKYPTKRCILIRENNDGCYLMTNTPPEDLVKLGQLVDLEDVLKHPSFNDFCTKVNGFDDGDILIGTYHRLKEGISVENAVWAVCTHFLWALATRIQLLGRIRRMSTNDFINTYPRYFLTSSSRIPTNQGELFVKKRYGKGAMKKFKLEVTYDENIEGAMFAKENYVRISKR